MQIFISNLHVQFFCYLDVQNILSCMQDTCSRRRSRAFFVLARLQPRMLNLLAQKISHEASERDVCYPNDLLINLLDYFLFAPLRSTISISFDCMMQQTGLLCSNIYLQQHQNQFNWTQLYEPLGTRPCLNEWLILTAIKQMLNPLEKRWMLVFCCLPYLF